MGVNMAGIEVPKLPLSLLHIAQLMLGIYIGLLLKKRIYIYRRSISFMRLFQRAFYRGSLWFNICDGSVVQP